MYKYLIKKSQPPAAGAVLTQQRQGELCEPARTREMSGEEMPSSAEAGEEHAPASPECEASSEVERGFAHDRSRSPPGQSSESALPNADAGEARRSLSQDSDVQWTVFLRKRGREKALDRRCMILWGLPSQLDPALLQARLGTRAKCWWRGRKSKRHMVLEFNSQLERTALITATRAKCKELGVKVAVVARDWTTREAHRRTKHAKPASAARPANVFSLLDEEEEFIALPTSGPDQSKRKRSLSNRKAGCKRAPALPGSKRSLKAQKKAQLGNELRRGKLRVGTFNAQGGLLLGIGALEDYAKRHSFDILAVQETRLNPSMKLSAKGYKVIRPSPELEDPQHGVLFLVASHLASGVATLTSEIANQLWIRLAGACDGQRDIVFGAVYMPQEGATKSIRDDAWATMKASASAYSVDSELVVLGDMNAKACSAANAEESRLLGQHCEPGRRSTNGSKLVKTMQEVGLISLAGHSEPEAPPAAKVGFWWTRRDKRTGTLHAIDYILVTPQLHASDDQKQCWVDYTDLDSDHQLVGATLQCSRSLVGKSSRPSRRRRFKTERLIQRSSSEKDVETAMQYREAYATALASSLRGYKPKQSRSSKCACDGDCACSTVKHFISRATAALERAVGSVPTGREFNRSWFDDEVKAAITKRQSIYAECLAQGFTQERWKRYRRARRGVRRLVKAKQRADWLRFVRDIEAAYKGDHRRLWQLVKRLVPSGKKAVLEPVRRPDGSLAKSEEQILEAWAEHQERLGQPSVDAHDDGDFTARVERQVQAVARLSPTLQNTALDGPFSMKELDTCLQKLQYHKAGTDDRTTSEMFLFGGEEMKGILLGLFNHLRETESIPADWQSSTIVNLYKEGDRADPGNYRGIALISCIGKLYLSLWAQRLASYGDSRLSESQGGFRLRRSTIDQAITFLELLQRRKAAKKDTFVCFVDFRKAFDTVWHDGLWKRLWDSNVRGKAWRIIRKLYAAIDAKVRLGTKTSRSVRMRQGVRQGCPLSPTLFNFFVDALSKKLLASGYGSSFEGLDVGALLYADDVVLIADSAEELQGLIDTVDAFCRKWKMSMNMKKSEVMVVRGSMEPLPDYAWVCRDQELKVVRKYKYLGIWFTDDLSWKEHINVTLAKVDKRTAGLSKVLRNKNVPPRAKALVWLAQVRPLLEYGAEVWHANDKQIRSLASKIHTAGKQILRLNSRTASAAVRALLRIPDIRRRHEQARLKYAGKLMAMDKDRLARVAILRGNSKWWQACMKLIAVHPGLQEGYAKLQRASARNHGVVPIGLDPTVDAGIDYSPLQAWNNTVDEWAANLTLRNFRRDRKPTLSVLQRALPEEAEEQSGGMPRYPLTRLANHGPNQIRLRLLCGTNALNRTMSKFGNRNPACPFDSCPHRSEEEDSAHFLLRCKGYERYRTQYREMLERKCTCNAESCSEFFDGLDDAGKVLFILGGPVDGRIPEASIDKHSRHFVRLAWARRCDALTSANPAASVTDLTEVAGSGRATTARHCLEEGVPDRGRVDTTRCLDKGVLPVGKRALAKPYTVHDITLDSRGTRILVDKGVLVAPEPPRRSSRQRRSRIAQSVTTTRATVSNSRHRNGSGPNVTIDKGRD